jgi:hypothetical protein
MYPSESRLQAPYKDRPILYSNVESLSKFCGTSANDLKLKKLARFHCNSHHPTSEHTFFLLGGLAGCGL